MKTSIAKTFNTTVLKVALNECEDRIAAVIAAFYDVILDDEMIQSSISNGMLEFI